jgi:hypothetical protein
MYWLLILMVLGSNPRVDKSSGKYFNYKRVKSAFIELAISPVKNALT